MEKLDITLNLELTYIIPIYNPKPRDIVNLISTFNSQSITNFEVVFSNDGSTITFDWQKIILLNAKFKYKIVNNDLNRGISAALNSAIENSSNEYIALVDQDDEIVPDCTKIILDVLKTNRNESWLYTDEFLKISENSKYINIQKNDFNLPELHASMYLNHIQIFSRDKLGNELYFDTEYDGSQDHELAIRLAQKGFTAFHIPHSLYIWNRTEKTLSSGRKSFQISDKCINSSLKALNENVSAGSSIKSHFQSYKSSGMYVLKFDELAPEPISIIIPTGCRKIPRKSKLLVEQLFKSIVETTQPEVLKNYEFILIASDNESKKMLTNRIRKFSLNIQILVQEGSFNFSKKVNLGISMAKNDFVFILNDDIVFLTPNLLQELLTFAQFYELSMVGPLVLSRDGRVQSAGDRVGSGSAHHIGTGLSPYFGLGNRIANLQREVSSITGACMLAKLADLKEIGGFDENFPSAYQDVVLCSAYKRLGKRIALFPKQKVTHWEGVTRGKQVLPLEWNLLSSLLSNELSKPDKLGFPMYSPGTFNNNSVSQILIKLIKKVIPITLIFLNKIKQSAVHEFYRILERFRNLV